MGKAEDYSVASMDKPVQQELEAGHSPMSSLLTWLGSNPLEQCRNSLQGPITCWWYCK